MFLQEHFCDVKNQLQQRAVASLGQRQPRVPNGGWVAGAKTLTCPSDRGPSLPAKAITKSREPPRTFFPAQMFLQEHFGDS